MVRLNAPDMSKTPALFSRQCSGSSLARKDEAKALTESSESRSRCITSQLSGSDSVEFHESTSACPRFTVRHASTTRAPALASVSAVVVPIPLVGPVTMKVFPFTSGPRTFAGSVGRWRVCQRCIITSSTTSSHVPSPMALSRERYPAS